MKLLLRFVSAMLLGLAISGCAVFRATGETVEATGEGAGHAVSETGRGAGHIVTGTGRAVVGAVDEVDDEIRR